MQTNGLLIKKLAPEINDSPITDLAVSMDGVKDTNDFIRGIRGYFDLGMEGIRALRGKRVAISVTFNRLSAGELDTLMGMARDVGAQVEYNILCNTISFLKSADFNAMWPEEREIEKIVSFMRTSLRRPAYEIDYIDQYFSHRLDSEPSCVLGYLQVFVLSNGDVMTGCFPLKPVGNIFRNTLAEILASEDYGRQCKAMIRRECPGCTCGVESSLAMKYAGSSGFFHLSRLTKAWIGKQPGAGPKSNAQAPPSQLVQVAAPHSGAESPTRATK